MGGPDPRSFARAVEALHADVLAAKGGASALRSAIERHVPEEATIASLLLRPLPAPFLELLAGTPPWSRNAVLLGRIVLNPGAPARLSLGLIPALFWRDLALVAASARVPAPVRYSAESALRERLADMRPGERTALARIATPSIAARLLVDEDPRVVEACLPNPRLRLDQVEAALRQANASRGLIGAVAGSARWTACYSIRLTLVLQPRTPLPTTLSLITSLAPGDLRRVARTPGLAPLVRAAARTVLERNPLAGGRRNPSG